MQITMQRTRPAWPARTKLRMALNCSRIAKQIAMISGIFVEGRRQTMLNLARDKNKKDHKKLRKKLVDHCPKQGDQKQRTLKQRNKQSGSKCTNHK